MSSLKFRALMAVTEYEIYTAMGNPAAVEELIARKIKEIEDEDKRNETLPSKSSFGVSQNTSTVA